MRGDDETDTNAVKSMDRAFFNKNIRRFKKTKKLKMVANKTRKDRNTA